MTSLPFQREFLVVVPHVVAPNDEIINDLRNKLMGWNLGKIEALFDVVLFIINDFSISRAEKHSVCKVLLIYDLCKYIFEFLQLHHYHLNVFHCDVTIVGTYGDKFVYTPPSMNRVRSKNARHFEKLKIQEEAEIIRKREEESILTSEQLNEKLSLDIALKAHDTLKVNHYSKIGEVFVNRKSLDTKTRRFRGPST